MIAHPLVLLILDGWGHKSTKEHNAITMANTPTWDHLWTHAPHTLLSTSGLDVGLPKGQMGNSEVGHMTLGAGRVIYQDLTRIDLSIQDKTFFNNEVLIQCCHTDPKNYLHVFILLSPGGIHSHENHLFAFIELAKQQGVKNLVIHAFLDGRDTPPKSAANSITRTEIMLQQAGIGRIASITGRYYAMDRDKRFERTQLTYDLLTLGQTPFIAPTAEQALVLAYARNETDEFVQPTLIGDPSTWPIITDHDTVLFLNFRADRARQLSYAFTDKNFDGFIRTKQPQLKQFVTLTEYAQNIQASIAFPKPKVENVLGQYLADHGLSQLRIAETEKYAHVTFFFNAGQEAPFEKEDRILIPSPRVSTYDQQPEMSALEVTTSLCTAILEKKYDVIVCNFANPDMVGHTGNLNATIKAIEIVDQCIVKILQATEAIQGQVLITADHGNAEIMFDNTTQQSHTAHTLEPVPFVYVGPKTVSPTQPSGTLSDVAPTILSLIGLQIPSEMTGHALFKEKS